MAAAPSPSFVLKKAVEAVTDLCFWDTNCFQQRGGSYLIAGYGDRGGIEVWDLTTRRVTAQYPSDVGVLSNYGTDFWEIVSLNREGELKLIDAKTGISNSIATIPNVGFCKASCLDVNGILLVAVTGEDDSSVAVWDLRKQKIRYRLIPSDDCHFGMVMCIKLFEDPDKMNLMCLGGYEDGSMVLWNVEKGKVVQRLVLFNMEPVMCFDCIFASDNNVIQGIAGSPSEVVRKFVITKFDAGEDGMTVEKNRSLKSPGIADIKIRGDGKIVAAGGWGDGGVRIFSFRTLKPLAVLKYHGGTVRSLAFRHDCDANEQILASGSDTHTIAFWDIYL